MDYLSELSNSLNKKELSQLKSYIKSKSNNYQRKDLTVLETVIQKGKYDSKEMVSSLYGKTTASGLNAHRAIRHRLKDHIEHFIYQHVPLDDTPLRINKLTTISRFLYFRKKHNLSWHYLEKAESLAKQAEEYELLSQVYQYMVEYAWGQPQEKLNLVIEKIEKNQEMAKSTQIMNIALSVIRNKIRKHQEKGHRPDIEKLIQSTLSKFKIENFVLKKASQYYKLAMLIKISLEEKGDYEGIYKYMIHTIDEMENAKLFDKFNYRYRIDMLNAICYSAAGAGEYDLSEKYMKTIEEENQLHPETELFSLRSYMAKVVCLALTDKLPKALEVLEFMKKEYKKIYINDDHFFVTLNSNFISIHFQLNEIVKSKKYLNELLNHSNRIKRYNGLEYLFNCQAIECILAIESNQIEYADYRISSMQKKFNQMLHKPYHRRKAFFLQLVKDILNDNEPWKSNKLRRKVLSFLQIEPIYKASSEFISFNAWLYSKIKNQAYHEGNYNQAAQENNFWKEEP